MTRWSERTIGRMGHRWATASRALAGTLGTYCVTALAVTVLSLLLVRCGMTRVEAATAATLISFALFAGIALTVFHARNIKQAWCWLAAAAALLGLALAILR